MTRAILWQLIQNYGHVVLFTIAAFLLLEVTIRAVTRRRRVATEINKRAKIAARAEAREVTLEQFRREQENPLIQYVPLARRLRRLMVQSGARISMVALASIALLLGLVGWFGLGIFVNDLPIRLLLTLLLAVGLPLLVLARLRSRRIAAFEEQLPDAIDVIVRSLKAGHPVPVSVSMVAREMPDPIGSEFAVASNEMTYGLDLETALANLRDRAGQGDLAFLVVAIGMQAKTGGNLAEILAKLSKLLRDRMRMRRKVKALSAEGRASAVALSLVPVLLFAFLQFFVPKFYGDVSHEPIIAVVAYITLFVWFIGVVVMYRMVNFRV